MSLAKQKIKTAILSIFSVVLFSCASSSHEIAATYVSPTQYAAFNCDQLSLELSRLNRRKADLAANIDKKANSDESMTAVTMILFWPAAFALGGNEAQEAEYARLKGEYDAVQKAGIEKNCQLDPKKTTVSPLIANYPADKASQSSAFEFFGEAEEEVNSGNLNKDIWARALVEVEGDETKRKAKYIELRANQLYLQNGGVASNASHYNQSASKTGNLSNDISGVYKSEITSNSNFIFKRQHRELVITFTQNGGKITGIDRSRKVKINGSIEGDIVSFYILPSVISGDEINGTWKVNSDTTQLVGKWSSDGHGGASGKWNLTRIE